MSTNLAVTTLSAVSHLALEAVHKAIVLGAKTSLTTKTVFEITTVLAVNQLADGCSALFDKAGTGRLVTEH